MKLKYFNHLMLGGVLALGVAGAQTVGEREANQQQRIQQGAASGELTHHETKKLEKKEAHIRREVRRDRAENGGYLTPSERAHVAKQQNHVSKKIYKEKHDNQVQ
jgi:hypothetical protein